MSVPIVKKCCCCVSLHTGTLIIGCLYSLCGLAVLIWYTLLVTLRPLSHDGKVSTHKYVLYISAAFIGCLHLLVSILLVVAAVKKLAFMTLPWTIITGMITAITFVMGLMGISLMLQDGTDIVIEDAVFVVISLVTACVSSYCIVVVHSRHKEMMNERQMRGLRYRAVRPSADDTKA